MSPSIHIGTLDIIILVGYVLCLGGIGWWAAKKTAHSTSDYFLANRSIPWLVTAASFLATIISALTFIGTPGEGYAADYRYLFGNVGDILAALFVATVFLPVFQKLGVTSIYEVVEHRFGVGTRRTASAYFLVSRLLASTVRIVAIAKVLEVVTGGSISYTMCVWTVMITILLYTTIGGGRAIAWTDLMQFILLISGALIALVYLILHVPGGVTEIIERGKNAVAEDGTTYNKFNFLKLFEPENLNLFFLIAIWAFFQSTAAYGTDQDMVQRLLACNNQKKARWSLMLSILTSIPITFLFLSIGVCLYAYSHYHPELIAGMTDTDHIFPRFILTALPEGLKGLLLAAVASAAMGSSDSALAALSTAFVVDFYKPIWGRNADEEKCVKVSKICFISFGIFMGICAVLVRRLDHLLWLGFKIVAFTYGPLLGLFAVCILTKWKIAPKKIITLMITMTLFLTTIGYCANEFSQNAKEGFWFAMQTKYWRLYIIVGALSIPAIGYFLRDKNRINAAS